MAGGGDTALWQSAHPTTSQVQSEPSTPSPDGGPSIPYTQTRIYKAVHGPPHHSLQNDEGGLSFEPHVIVRDFAEIGLFPALNVEDPYAPLSAPVERCQQASPGRGTETQSTLFGQSAGRSLFGKYYDEDETTGDEGDQDEGDSPDGLFAALDYEDEQDDDRYWVIDDEDSQDDGQYVHDRNPGLSRHDFTAYLRSQKYWGLDDDARPEILWQLERQDYQCPRYEPEDWICPWTGSTVYDASRGENFKDYRDLPEQLSSQVEGWLLEAIRRTDPRIHLKDISVRIRPGAKGDDMTTHASGNEARTRRLHNALQMRQVRFRMQYRLISWDKRDGSDLTSRLTKAELTPEQLANNTTRGTQKRTVAEIKAIKAGVVPKKDPERVEREPQTEPASSGETASWANRDHSDLSTLQWTPMDVSSSLGPIGTKRQRQTDPEVNPEIHRAAHGGDSAQPQAKRPRTEATMPAQPWQPVQQLQHGLAAPASGWNRGPSTIDGSIPPPIPSCTVPQGFQAYLPTEKVHVQPSMSKLIDYLARGKFATDNAVIPPTPLETSTVAPCALSGTNLTPQPVWPTEKIIPAPLTGTRRGGTSGVACGIPALDFTGATTPTLSETELHSQPIIDGLFQCFSSDDSITASTAVPCIEPQAVLDSEVALTFALPDIDDLDFPDVSPIKSDDENDFIRQLEAGGEQTIAASSPAMADEYAVMTAEDFADFAWLENELVL